MCRSGIPVSRQLRCWSVVGGGGPQGLERWSRGGGWPPRGRWLGRGGWGVFAGPGGAPGGWWLGGRGGVVWGGAGRGRRGFRRRYAREAAQAALRQLEGGADPDAVEVPLFTTWGRWVAPPGSPMESLVEASFAAGLG